MPFLYRKFRKLRKHGSKCLQYENFKFEAAVRIAIATFYFVLVDVSVGGVGGRGGGVGVRDGFKEI